ncbi:MAG: hypothetical protein HDR06_12195 [Lachnospiraceae bacterium]|nr:hypothetical protein [Lachnospiraceae bacterium]
MRTVGMGTSKDDKTPDSALKKENKELKKSVKELTAENTALKKTVEDLTVENTALETELDALSGAVNDGVAPVQQDGAK